MSENLFGLQRLFIEFKEPLNQSAAAHSESFAPACRLEIRKGFLQFSNLNLEQNPSLTTLAIESEVPQICSISSETKPGRSFF